MTDFRIVNVTSYQNNFEVTAPSLLAYIKANPGSSHAELAAGESLDEGIVRDLTQLMEIMNLVVQVSDETGTSVVWHVSDWATALESNLDDARTWLETNNNELMTKMRDDLSIPHEIAERLGWLLEYEGTSRRVSV